MKHAATIALLSVLASAGALLPPEARAAGPYDGR